MKRTYLFAVGVFMILLFSVCAMDAFAAETGEVKVTGLRLQYVDDGSIQAFADVALSNIQATGVDFVVSYDYNYLTPSEYDTNKATRNASLSLKENTEVFKDVIEKSSVENALDLGYSQILSDKVEVNIVPNSKVTKGGYISEVSVNMPETKKVKSLNITDSDVTVVTLSFKVLDNDKFLSLGDTEIANLLKVNSNARLIYVNGSRIEYFDETLLSVEMSVEMLPTKMFNLVGIVSGFNPYQPFVLDIYTKQGDTESLVKTVKSTDTDEDGNLLYGPTAHTMGDWYAEWTFSVPLDRGYDYIVRLKKLSHISYIDVAFTAPEKDVAVNFNAVARGESRKNEAIKLFCGDIDNNGRNDMMDEMWIDIWYHDCFNNFDGTWDGFDYDDPKFQAIDLNGDGCLNDMDFFVYSQNAYDFHLEKSVEDYIRDAETSAIELIPGDINSDGLVSYADRAEFMRFFNLQKSKDVYVDEFNKSDLDGDGVVSFSDYDILTQNFDKVYG